jgi:hypothetical protein
MLKVFVRVVGIGILLWVGTLYAHSQQATEIFIPIGQSPGVSAKITIIGKIHAVNAQTRTVNIAGPSGTVSCQITDRTNIWLDRSKVGRTNKTGTVSDLRPGLVVEVKYEGRERRSEGPAEWIKVQLEAS